MAHPREAGAEHVLGGGMIERIVIAGTDDGEIIGALLQLGIGIGDFQPGLPAPGERLFAAVNRRVHFGEL